MSKSEQGPDRAWAGAAVLFLAGIGMIVVTMRLPGLYGYDWDRVAQAGKGGAGLWLVTGLFGVPSAFLIAAPVFLLV